MAEKVIMEMLEAAAHFGHRTHKWNPKMREYLYGDKDGIHIFDLYKTYDCLEKPLLKARQFCLLVQNRKLFNLLQKQQTNVECLMYPKNG